MKIRYGFMALCSLAFWAGAQRFSATACAGTGTARSVAEAADALRAARNAGRPAPLVSRCCGVTDLARAYRVQQAAADGDIAGYKAGLTGPEARQRFGIDHAVSGMLPKSGALPRGKTVNRSRFHAPMLEMEVVFVVGADIRETPESVDALRPFLANVAPALEIPDLHFSDREMLRVEDIVAANVAARAFLLGPEKPLADVSLDDGYGVLMKDHQIATRGKMADVMGHPLNAALWLVRHRLELGQTVRRGDLLFTGAIGGMIPMTEGDYLAEFGDLGIIPFRVRRLGVSPAP